METRESLEEKVLALSEDDRAILLDRLIASIDPKKRAEFDSAWAQEAEERFRAYQVGDMEGLTVEESKRRLAESRTRTRI